MTYHDKAKAGTSADVSAKSRTRLMLSAGVAAIALSGAAAMAASNPAASTTVGSTPPDQQPIAELAAQTGTSYETTEAAMHRLGLLKAGHRDNVSLVNYRVNSLPDL